jgi:hypothetical protein
MWSRFENEEQKNLLIKKRLLYHSAVSIHTGMCGYGLWSVMITALVPLNILHTHVNK